MSRMCVMPFFSRMTPVDSNTSPTSKIKSSFVINCSGGLRPSRLQIGAHTAPLQVLITNQFDAELSHQVLHAWTDEGIEFMLKFVERRMRVKLGIAGRQFGQQFQNVFFVHARILQQAKRDLRVLDAALAQWFAGTAGKPFVNRRV